MNQKLYDACYTGNLEGIDETMRPKLHLGINWACHYGNMHIVKKLLEMGGTFLYPADIRAYNKWSTTIGFFEQLLGSDITSIVMLYYEKTYTFELLC